MKLLVAVCFCTLLSGNVFAMKTKEIKINDRLRDGLSLRNPDVSLKVLKHLGQSQIGLSIFCDGETAKNLFESLENKKQFKKTDASGNILTTRVASISKFKDYEGFLRETPYSHCQSVVKDGNVRNIFCQTRLLVHGGIPHDIIHTDDNKFIEIVSGCVGQFNLKKVKLPRWRVLKKKRIPFYANGFACHGETAEALFNAVEDKINDCYENYIPYICRADLPLGIKYQKGNKTILTFGNSFINAPSFCEKDEYGKMACFVGAVIN